MIVNGIKYDLESLELPDFKKAKELCKTKVKALANGNILYMYPYVNVETTKSGVKVPKNVIQGIATIVKEQGGLLVDVCPSNAENIQVGHIKPGSYVRIAADQHDIKHGFHLKENNEIKWEALVLPAYCIVCEVVKPNYNTDINYKPQVPPKPTNLTM